MGPSSVTVVMPTFNRRDRLARAIAALEAQEVDLPFDVVVVSDGSTDGTDEMLAEIEPRVPLRAFSQSNGGPAAARNRGLSEATGELIVFIDDDIVAGRGLIQAHVDAHRTLGDAMVVVGPMIDPDDAVLAPWVRWEQAMLRKQYAALEAGEYEATARQFYTGNASVLRRYVVGAGGFDTAFRRAEDVELAYRLEDHGLRFAYVPSAIGFHYADRSYASWKSMAYVYGQNDVVFARDLGRTWIYAFTSRKFRQHRAPLRVLITISLLSDPIRRLIVAAAARAANGFRRDALARSAYSAIYGIEFHAGIRDELGGRRAFFRLVRTGRP